MDGKKNITRKATKIARLVHLALLSVSPSDELGTVHREKVNHLDHLQRCITATCMAVTTHNLKTVGQRWVTRLQVCVRQDKQCT